MKVELITNIDTIDSRILAEITNVKHASVLKTISRIENNLSDTQTASLWKLSTYVDFQKKNRKRYLLTKKGLLFIVSKYDDNLRLALIERLEFLEKERLKTQQILAERAWDQEDRLDLIPRWR